MSQPQSFPLAWPSHRPRKSAADRRKGSFVADKKRVTMAAAVDKLEDQISRLGGRYPLLSSNVETRMDGRPRSGQTPPKDPGVAVYFELKGKPMTMACDTFTEVAQNIASIANHIDTVRRQEGYGVGHGRGELAGVRSASRARRDHARQPNRVAGSRARASVQQPAD